MTKKGNRRALLVACMHFAKCWLAAPGTPRVSAVTYLWGQVSGPAFKYQRESAVSMKAGIPGNWRWIAVGFRHEL